MPDAIQFYRGDLGFAKANASEEIDVPAGRYFHWAWLPRRREPGANAVYEAATAGCVRQQSCLAGRPTTFSSRRAGGAGARWVS
jgi:hypothetical protein